MLLLFGLLFRLLCGTFLTCTLERSLVVWVEAVEKVFLTEAAKVTGLRKPLRLERSWSKSGPLGPKQAALLTQ